MNKTAYLKESKLDIIALSGNQKDKLKKRLEKLGYQPRSVFTDLSQSYLYLFDDTYETGVSKTLFKHMGFKEIKYNDIFTSLKNKLK